MNDISSMQIAVRRRVRAASCSIVEGGAAIAASFGLLSLTPHDIRAMVYALIGHFHLDPDAQGTVTLA